MFVLTVVMSAILMFFVFVTFSGNLKPTASIDVLKDPVLTVPAQIRIGEQFTYNLKGEKLVDASGVTRRQIECNGNGVNLIEVIDTIEPRANLGKFEFNRLMTIPTYKQNLKANPKCRLVFNATYNFYYSTATQENARVIPVVETFFSNEFELLPADPNAPTEPQNGTSQNEVDTGVTPEERSAPETNTRDPITQRQSSAPPRTADNTQNGGSSYQPPAQEDDPNFLESIVNMVDNGVSDVIETVNPFD